MSVHYFFLRISDKKNFVYHACTGQLKTVAAPFRLICSKSFFVISVPLIQSRVLRWFLLLLYLSTKSSKQTNECLFSIENLHKKLSRPHLKTTCLESEVSAKMWRIPRPCMFSFSFFYHGYVGLPPLDPVCALSFPRFGRGGGGGISCGKKPSRAESSPYKIQTSFLRRDKEREKKSLLLFCH